MTLLELAIIIILIYALYKMIVFLLKRLALFITVTSLGRLAGVWVTDLRPFAFFSPFISEYPVARVKVYQKAYAIRLFSGKDYLHVVHLANREFAAVFLKSGGATKVRRFVRSMRAVREASRVYFPRTVIIKPIKSDPDDTEIMIFSPAPRELTYVTESRTSIAVAFTGDEIYGRKIFTKTTFKNYIDRDTRGFYDETNAKDVSVSKRHR